MYVRVYTIHDTRYRRVSCIHGHISGVQCIKLLQSWEIAFSDFTSEFQNSLDHLFRVHCIFYTVISTKISLTFRSLEKPDLFPLMDRFTLSRLPDLEARKEEYSAAHLPASASSHKATSAASTASSCFCSSSLFTPIVVRSSAKASRHSWYHP